MLKEYRKKRNFKRTTEPKGVRAASRDAPIFVIHEHDASHHHFDIRLEANGVLKSWAVPKGMPTATEKHLAVQTEDHPLAYADFKGIIPEGEYGAGRVKIHDRGIFENLTHNKYKKPITLIGGLRKGHILFRLQGKRYKNKVYTLHRFKKEGKKSLWLLLLVEKK
jgi:DNA ligase D-like protein (predicted 3'-phosphoesterase)